MQMMPERDGLCPLQVGVPRHNGCLIAFRFVGHGGDQLFQRRRDRIVFFHAGTSADPERPDRSGCARCAAFSPHLPHAAVSTSSTNIWISSQAGSKESAPLSRSARIPSSPAIRMSASSCPVIIPVAASMAACAMLPLISCRYIRLSNPMEELKSSAIRVGCAVTFFPPTFLP